MPSHTLNTSLFLSFSVFVYVGDARMDSASAQGSLVHLEGASGLAEPYFADDNVGGGAGGPQGLVNVTAQLGITTYLHCKVNSLGGKTVSSG